MGGEGSVKTQEKRYDRCKAGVSGEDIRGKALHVLGGVFDKV